MDFHLLHWFVKTLRTFFHFLQRSQHYFCHVNYVISVFLFISLCVNFRGWHSNSKITFYYTEVLNFIMLIIDKWLSLLINLRKLWLNQRAQICVGKEENVGILSDFRFSDAVQREFGTRRCVRGFIQRFLNFQQYICTVNF